MDAGSGVRTQCAEWSDDYLLAQFALGASAFADAAAFESIRAEAARRGLPEPPSPPDAPALPRAPRRLREHLFRLWRGQLPLATTYWGWGVLGSLAYGLLITGAWALVPSAGRFENLLATLVFAAAIGYFGYYLLIAVAIWRSAGRYTGKQAWATLARVALLVGLSASIWRLVGALTGARPN